MRDKIWKNSGENGQALLEFALIFPVLMLIIMGCIEFSWYFTSRYGLDHYSKQVGYNVTTPMSLTWKHMTTPRSWIDADSGRKPDWLTGQEKRAWSFDEYDGWYSFGEPAEGSVIGRGYIYAAYDTESRFRSRLNAADTVLTEDRIDYTIRGGWYIKAEALHMPKGGGAGWMEERSQERTEYYYADVVVDISYEYRPVTFVGKLFLCPPGSDSVVIKESNRYIYHMNPAWLSS